MNDETFEFYILNDADKPCPRLLAVKVPGGLKYIDPGYKNEQLFPIGPATRIEDFGFSVYRGHTREFRFVQERPSRATYRRSGEIRHWQDVERFVRIVPLHRFEEMLEAL